MTARLHSAAVGGGSATRSFVVRCAVFTENGGQGSPSSSGARRISKEPSCQPRAVVSVMVNVEPEERKYSHWESSSGWVERTRYCSQGKLGHVSLCLRFQRLSCDVDGGAGKYSMKRVWLRLMLVRFREVVFAGGKLGGGRRRIGDVKTGSRRKPCTHSHKERMDSDGRVTAKLVYLAIGRSSLLVIS